MRQTLLLISGFLFLLFVSCTSENQPVKVSHGFYFWKSNFDEYSDSILSSNKVDVVYHRIFDLAWDGEGVVPTSNLYQYYYPDLSKPRQFIPVIYITNEVFKNLSDSSCIDLADKIYHRLRMYFYAQANSLLNSGGDEYDYEFYGPDKQIDFDTNQPRRLDIDSMVNSTMRQFSELQIDCDWTPQTRARYFKFLKACKKKFQHQQISCTIRLYPFKYQKEMGVPPVDRGMLMCYNINDVRTRGKNNSIFDLAEAKKYLTSKIAYPIPLDYALPMFSWSAVYENDRLTDLSVSRELYTGEYSDVDPLLTDSAKGIYEYRVQEENSNVYIDGNLLKPGTIIRQEEPNKADVLQLAELLKTINVNPSPRVVLYHFDAYEFKKNAAYVRNVFKAF